MCVGVWERNTYIARERERENLSEMTPEAGSRTGSLIRVCIVCVSTDRERERERDKKKEKKKEGKREREREPVRDETRGR